MHFNSPLNMALFKAHRDLHKTYEEVIASGKYDKDGVLHLPPLPDDIYYDIHTRYDEVTGDLRKVPLNHQQFLFGRADRMFKNFVAMSLVAVAMVACGKAPEPEAEPREATYSVTKSFTLVKVCSGNTADLYRLAEGGLARWNSVEDGAEAPGYFVKYEGTEEDYCPS